MQPEKPLALVLLLTAGSAVADAPVESALEAVRAQLRDPGSAVFENVRAGGNPAMTSHRSGVCGVVNAKNGYGGYAGRKRFVVMTDDPADLKVTIEHDGPSLVLIEAYCTAWGIR